MIVPADIATLAALTTAAAVVMTRLEQREGRIRLRWEHRCVSCGAIVHSRVCPRCGDQQVPKRSE